jgi:hypothetical protein
VGAFENFEGTFQIVDMFIVGNGFVGCRRRRLLRSFLLLFLCCFLDIFIVVLIFIVIRI